MEFEDWERLLPQVKKLLKEFHSGGGIFIINVIAKKKNNSVSLGSLGNVNGPIGTSEEEAFEICSENRTIFTQDIRYISEASDDIESPDFSNCIIHSHSGQLMINESMPTFLKRIGWECL
jgi:hypothetical protein